MRAKELNDKRTKEIRSKKREYRVKDAQAKVDTAKELAAKEGLEKLHEKDNKVETNRLSKAMKTAIQHQSKAASEVESDELKSKVVRVKQEKALKGHKERDGKSAATEKKEVGVKQIKHLLLLKESKNKEIHQKKVNVNELKIKEAERTQKDTHERQAKGEQLKEHQTKNRLQKSRDTQARKRQLRGGNGWVKVSAERTHKRHKQYQSRPKRSSEEKLGERDDTDIDIDQY